MSHAESARRSRPTWRHRSSNRGGRRGLPCAAHHATTPRAKAKPRRAARTSRGLIPFTRRAHWLYPWQPRCERANSDGAGSRSARSAWAPGASRATATAPSRPTTARNTLEAALDEGCTFIETADCYAEGRVESLIGEVLQARGRDKAVVSTRVGVDRSGEVARKRFDPAYITRACEASLKRLQTDYVDALVLHNPAGVRPSCAVRRGSASAPSRRPARRGSSASASGSVEAARPPSRAAPTSW